MKKSLLLIFLLINCHYIFTQELLDPIKSTSFGLNQHTNRDIAYFSHVDSNKNSIVISTTERDSTFTDILTTKLDINHNLIWQKRLSIDTNLSYDIPLKSFVNSNNEIYIIGRSSFNQSNSNGLIFIVKYDKNGDLKYNRTIGNIDGSDYVDYNYMDVVLNSDSTLNLVYALYGGTNGVYLFNFLKVDAQGAIINSFSKTLEYQSIKGKIHNENYYFLTKEDVDQSNGIYLFKLHKIKNENTYTSIQIEDVDFTNYYKIAAFSRDIIMNIDGDQNVYIVGDIPSSNNTKSQINLSKIDVNNELNYSITTSDTNDFSLINAFIDDQNSNTVITNNIDTESVNFLEVDDNNTLQTIAVQNNLVVTGFKKNKDGSFFLTTSNENIRLFSKDLNELKSFTTSDTYELIDFSKIDDNTITTVGIKYDKMFPESDFYTQLDIISEKMDVSQIIGEYMYSGIGTSAADNYKLIIDNDNNYLVLVTEALGPEYLGIGGQNPPNNKRIMKYDSDLNLIWELQFPDSILDVVNFGGSEIKHFLDSDNTLYLNLPKPRDAYSADYDLYKVSSDGELSFLTNSVPLSGLIIKGNELHIASISFQNTSTGISQFKTFTVDKNSGETLAEFDIEKERFLTFYEKDSDIYFYTMIGRSGGIVENIYIYKNNEKIYTRNLPYNTGVFPMILEKDGALIFEMAHYGIKKINKIDLNNSFKHYTTNRDIARIRRYGNGNIYTFFENNTALILDYDLNFKSAGQSMDAYQPNLLSLGNYMLIGTNFDNRIRLLDQDGRIIKDFKTQGNLLNSTARFDQHNNLIMVGSNGNKISTFNEYRWNRGFMHTLNVLDNVLSVEETDNNNALKDYSIYPNPSSGIFNVKIKDKLIERVIVYDISGKQLKEFKTSKIDLVSFKSGLYLIKIFTNSSSVINSKIIKN